MQKFKRILVANRGEIAIRVFRACRELGIRSVAIYSEEDKNSLFRTLADESYQIGKGKSPVDAYLDINEIIALAKAKGVDAIHPGYGFLSENSEFAERCEKAGIVFIGPTHVMMDALGDKIQSKIVASSVGVPTIPGIEKAATNEQEVLEYARFCGYPVILKASAGGGGRGMRRAYSEAELENAFLTAKSEAKACFGDDDIYMEKLIVDPKHIEFQILADQFGHVVHLGERDCSVQRRNQKMIEEAPSKALKPELRAAMGEASVRAAQGVGYQNAGTIEYVLDQDGHFYFIEMNTRIQVEHPVTEMVTGVDLIREQIRIASGLPLELKQEDIVLRGHAIECRINAENPREGFRPSPGKVESIHLPGGLGVRIDTALYQNYQVSAHYDSMVAKIIVHGENRLEAIRRMRRVLSELVIEGIETNQELLYLIFHNAEYVKGNFNTSFIEKNLDELVK